MSSFTEPQNNIRNIGTMESYYHLNGANQISQKDSFYA